MVHRARGRWSLNTYEMKKSLLTAYLKNQQKAQSLKIGDLTLKNMEEVQEVQEVPTPEVEVAPEVTEEVAE